MGQITSKQLTTLIFLFLLTSIFIYLKPPSADNKKEVPLSNILSRINGWEKINDNPLAESIVDALELDDYVNQNFSRIINHKDIISLYIGYYYTGSKIGSAHDPLVCFPGQGWVVKDKGGGILKLEKKGDTVISYSTMIVEKEQERQLILYWFQSYDKTNPDTFSQKISSLWAKIAKRGEDNAFVRISVSIGDNPIDSYKDTILNFATAFYPVFLDYIIS